MEKIANDICKKIYITDDNLRKKKPQKIRKKIEKNINKKKKYKI